MAFSEQQMAAMISQVVSKAVPALVEQAVPLIQQQIAGDATTAVGELRKYAEETTANHKKATVDATIDRLARAGHLPPRLRETARKRLMREDARTPVEKFSEGGKEIELTAFDLAVREYEAFPSAFSEQLGGPGGYGSDAAPDAELEKVQRFSEDRRFASTLAVAGLTPKTFVEQFKEAQKHHPELTAEQFGVTAGA